MKETICEPAVEHPPESGPSAPAPVKGAELPDAKTSRAEDDRLPLKAELPGIIGWTLLAAVAFHVAAASPVASLLSVVYAFALLQLAQTSTWRRCFYPGLAVSLLIATLRLAFFWRIFGAGALALWLVYSVWIGLFVALAGASLRRQPRWGWVLSPCLWMGLEYFRSELYYLRFSWLSPSYGLGEAPWRGLLSLAGSYGTGFLFMSVACAGAFFWKRSKIRSVASLLLGTGALCLFGLFGRPGDAPPSARHVRVAGVQLEFPTEAAVLSNLNLIIRQYPETELVVLSEYTFQETVPASVRDWCRKTGRYLVVGGEEPAAGKNFCNTAFVIGPTGEILFRQVKAVPIQFFKDGLPAPDQDVWESPWGKIGICICYDLSYTRVTDRLVELGAEVLVVPTMDVAGWGQAQHELHARVAPVRAAEYGLPIFRLASSGISQWVDPTGHVLAAAPCPGEGVVLRGTLDFRGPGHLPVDRFLALAASVVTGVFTAWLPARALGSRFFRSRSNLNHSVA